MLEEKIERLIVAVTALNETQTKLLALQGGKPAAAAAAPAKGAAAAKGAAKKSKFTADQIKTAVIKVKDEIDEDAAKEIISNAGASGLAELITMTEAYDGVMAACEEALAGGGDDDGGLGGL